VGLNPYLGRAHFFSAAAEAMRRIPETQKLQTDA